MQLTQLQLTTPTTATKKINDCLNLQPQRTTAKFIPQPDGVVTWHAGLWFNTTPRQTKDVKI